MICACRPRMSALSSGDTEEGAVTLDPEKLVGKWLCEDSGMYELLETSKGRFRYYEERKAGAVSGILQRNGNLLSGDIHYVEGSSHAGAVRLRFADEEGALLSTFKGPSDTQWGSARLARRAQTSPISSPAAGSRPP